MRLGFDKILRPTLDKGSFDWEKRIYNFDYCDVLTRIGQVANINVIVRSYEQSRTTVCSNFLSIFNLRLRDLQVDDEILVNVTLPLSFYLKKFLENRLGRTLFETKSKLSTAWSLRQLTGLNFRPA